MHALMGSQVKSLLMIASQLSGYPIPQNIPDPVVISVSAPEMAKDECGGDDALNVIMCPILGFYEWPIATGKDARPERIWVRADAGSGSQNAITVHELTHWLQYHNGFHPAKCPDLFLIEYQAYTVTLEYQVVYENAPIPESYGVPGVSCPTHPEEKTK
jgi:hypothetical protein